MVVQGDTSLTMAICEKFSYIEHGSHMLAVTCFRASRLANMLNMFVKAHLLVMEEKMAKIMEDM